MLPGAKTCPACAAELPESEFYARQQKCKQCVKARSRAYYKANKEVCDERIKRYEKLNRAHLNAIRRAKERDAWVNNPEKIREKYRKKMARLRASNLRLRLAGVLRNRISNAIRAKGLIKSKKTVELLGCDVPAFMSHIEGRFKEGMSWSNYGDWHIDHVVPLASASSESEMVRLFHVSNLQPLWASENMAKGASL